MHIWKPHLFQQVVCARSRRVCHTVQLILRLFLWMQVCEWTEFPRMMSGIWSLMCDISISIQKQNFKQTRGNPVVQQSIRKESELAV